MQFGHNSCAFFRVTLLVKNIATDETSQDITSFTILTSLVHHDYFDCTMNVEYVSGTWWSPRKYWWWL